MFKYRIRMFFSELKVLLLMRSGSSRRTDTGTDPDTQTRMRGLAIGGCGWAPLSCSHRDDEEEYYGADPRPRSLAFEDNEDGSKPKGGSLDAASLPSLSESGMRSPQCRICFQGPEKVQLSNANISAGSCSFNQVVCCSVGSWRVQVPHVGASAALRFMGPHTTWRSAEGDLFKHVTRLTAPLLFGHKDP